MSSLYQRIDKMKDIVEKTKGLEKYYREAPRPSDEELSKRELRAIERLIAKVGDDVEDFTDTLEVGKDTPITEFDLSNIPPSISESDFKGVNLLTAITKTEEECFIIAFLPGGKFVKFKFNFNASLKTFENFTCEEWDIKKVLGLVPCEEIFTQVEKQIKAYNKSMRDRKPKHIQRQEFLVKIGG